MIIFVEYYGLYFDVHNIGGGMGVAKGPWPHLEFGGGANVYFGPT